MLQACDICMQEEVKAVCSNKGISLQSCRRQAWCLFAIGSKPSLPGRAELQRLGAVALDHRPGAAALGQKLGPPSLPVSAPRRFAGAVGAKALNVSCMALNVSCMTHYQV